MRDLFLEEKNYKDAASSAYLIKSWSNIFKELWTQVLCCTSGWPDRFYTLALCFLFLPFKVFCCSVLVLYNNDAVMYQF